MSTILVVILSLCSFMNHFLRFKRLKGQGALVSLFNGRFMISNGQVEEIIVDHLGRKD
jgi:hypothetical protein